MQENSIAATALFRELMRRRLLLAAGAVLGLVAGMFIIWTTPRQYIVEAVIGPADSGMSTGGIGGVAGQLARLGGLGSGSGRGFDSAIAVLKTRGLCADLAVKVGLRGALFPGGGRPSLKEIVFGAAPSVTDDDACEVLWSDVLALDVDRLSGVATLRATWVDSEQAAKWVNEMVRMTDDRLRQAAISDTQGSLRALQGMLTNEQSVEMREILAILVQQQLSRLAGTQGASSFAIAVMDPARPKAPQDYSWPRKKLVVIISGLSGILFASTVVMLLLLREKWSVD